MHSVHEHSSPEQHHPLGWGGGGTASNRTPASSIQWDYSFCLLTPLFEKIFSMSYAIGIVLATQLELLQSVAGPVCPSSQILTGGLGLFTPSVFR